MDHPTTLIEREIIYDVHGAGLYSIRLTRTYGEKTAAPASGMKKQRNKNPKEKNFCSQHHFINQYSKYNVEGAGEAPGRLGSIHGRNEHVPLSGEADRR
jgi:hypothetical protein